MNHSRTTCPFVIKGKIEDPLCFVGRKEELRQLTNWMSGSQPVSVNVVGERLTGKSSLLWHFTNTWAQRVPDPSRFLVVFICLRLSKPTTEEGFYQALAKTLRDKLPNLPAFSGGCSTFKEEILDKLAEQGLLPVFCLDEFEKLFDHLGELNKDFYDRLGGLLKSNRMMLIIATRKPLKIYGEEYQLESAFFNFGMMQRLGDFSEDEVDKLVCLPVTGPPALDMEKQQLAQSWGGRQPYRLQLAALSLFEAQRNRKNTKWAKRQFNEQLGQTKLRSGWSPPLLWKRIKLKIQSLRDELAEDKCKKALGTVLLILAVIGGVYALLIGKKQIPVPLDWLVKLIPK